MSVRTNNVYGKIVISDSTIARFIARVAQDCYGIVEFVPKNLLEGVISFLRFGTQVKGIKVKTSGARIFVEVSAIVKYGVSIKAVIDALNESIKYKVEKFTGMICDSINVRVMGIRK